MHNPVFPIVSNTVNAILSSGLSIIQKFISIRMSRVIIHIRESRQKKREKVILLVREENWEPVPSSPSPSLLLSVDLINRSVGEYSSLVD